MTWVLTTALCIVLVEFVVRIPIPAVVSEISIVLRKALHILGAKSVSDHWKQKALLAYASSLLVSTMKLAGLLMAIGALAVLWIVVFDYFGAPISDFIISWKGILFSILVATIYFRMRQFFV